MNPYLGSIVRMSCPNSCKNKGTFVENSARLETFANGIISVVLKYIFLTLSYDFFTIINLMLIFLENL